MKRPLSLALFFCALFGALAAAPAAAEPNFGPVVNDYCTAAGQEPAQPYAPGDCALCHLPGFFDGDPDHQTPLGPEFKNGNYDAFCPPAVANNPPVLDPIGPRMTVEGQNLSFTVTASDADMDALTITATGLPAGAAFTDNGDGTADFDWTPALGQAGVVVVTFMVTDPSMDGAMEDVTITVFNANRPPVLAAIGNQTVPEGENLTLNLSATDPDANGVAFSVGGLPTGATFVDAGNGTATFSWTPGFGAAANYPVTFTVTDDGSPVASASEQIVIAVGDVNRPPVLNPVGDQTVNEGESLSVPLASSDPDGDSLALSAMNLPAGASLTDNGDGTGSLDWTPGFDQTGNHSITLTVTDDGSPSATDSEPINVAVGDVNRPPVLAPIGSQVVGEGQTLAIAVTATDPDGDALTVQAADLPTGATFSDNGDGTGSFSFTPAFGQTGNVIVTFTVTDLGMPALSDSEPVTISVGDVNRPPAIQPIGDQMIDEGQLLQFAVTASDPDADGVSLEAVNAPAGSMFTDNGDGTGTFSWTPGFAEMGNHAVTFNATDDGTPPAAASETITISVGNVNRPPVLNPAGNFAAGEGQLLTFMVSASDPDGDAVSCAASGLPAGASFTDNGDGTGTFSWTPAFGQTGNHVVTFEVSDEGSPALTVSGQTTITVGDVNRPPVIQPIGDRAVLDGELLRLVVTATDADRDAIALSVQGAPEAAIFSDFGNGTATFEWRPDEGDLAVYNVTFAAVDDGTPPAMASETIRLTLGDVINPDLVIDRIQWSTSFGGSLHAGGGGAAPGALVRFLDSPSQEVLGEVYADDNGNFTTGQCMVKVKKVRGKKKKKVYLNCILPPIAPCALQVHTGGVFSEPTAVPGAPAECGVGSPTLIQGIGSLSSDKRKLAVSARHLPRLTVAQIRDALSDEVLATVRTSETGMIDATLLGKGRRCALRLAVRFAGSDVFSPPLPVRQRRDGRWRSACKGANNFALPSSITGAAAIDEAPSGLPVDPDAPVVPGPGQMLPVVPGAAPDLQVDPNLVFSSAEWSASYGGSLHAEGSGAAARALVSIVDADSGAVIGEYSAGEDGSFDTGLCLVQKKSGKKRVTMSCIRPPLTPCAIHAVTGGVMSPRMDVAGVGECGPASPALLMVGAYLRDDKRRLQVSGNHAARLATVEIRDAITDEIITRLAADGDGSFSVTGLAKRCAIRVAQRYGSRDLFSDPVVMQKKRNRKWRPACTLPAAGVPDPAPIDVPLPEPDPVLVGPPMPADPPPVDPVPPVDPAPPVDPGPGDPPPADLATRIQAFSETVHPITSQYCVGCHAGAGPGSPHLAAPDSTQAYHAVVENQKVDLGSPYDSRLVQRVLSGHFCWSNCADDAEELRAAIAAWAQIVGDDMGGADPANGIASLSQVMADGLEGGGGLRNDANVIALWKFEEGKGIVAYDRSGVLPVMNLELSGTEWVAGDSLENKSGKAIASAEASRKLFLRIADPNAGSQQYTIEAWVTPANTDQNGPARIVSYSDGTQRRNFTLGQAAYNYVFRNRSRAGGIGENGTPALETADADEDLQATLQHVVMTFDQVNGRRIYVNGRDTGDDDLKGPGMLDNWNPNYRFLLGNETTDNRLWKGKFHFVAIHDRALTAGEVASHFQAGAGQTFLLRFDVSQWTGLAGSHIQVGISEFDAHSYLFSNPTYVGPAGGGIPIRNLRVAVNGVAPVAGQAFRNIDTTVTESGQLLSPLGSVISKERGAELDSFTLLFEVLGNNQAVVAETNAPVVPGGYLDEARPSIGLRDFHQLNETMAALTGVNPGSRNVRNVFAELTQQLPGDNDVRTFVAAHQVGIFKLALEYCDGMVESRSLRDAFFGPGFGFNQAPDAAFADPEDKNRIADALADRMIGVDLEGLPGREEVRPVVIDLIDTLTQGCGAGQCEAEDTQTVVKAACTAVLSSAPVMLH